MEPAWRGKKKSIAGRVDNSSFSGQTGMTWGGLRERGEIGIIKERVKIRTSSSSPGAGTGSWKPGGGISGLVPDPVKNQKKSQKRGPHQRPARTAKKEVKKNDEGGWET